MRKVLSVLLAMLMVIGLTACGKGTNETDKNALQNGLADYTGGVKWTDSLYDFQIKLDGTVYQFPMTLSDFMKQGWTFSDREDKDVLLEAEAYDFCHMTYKGEVELMVEVVNFAKSALPITDTYIGGIIVSDAWWEDGQKSAEMAKGIVLGTSTEADITAAYGSPVDTYDGSSYKDLEYEVDMNSGITFEIDTETGKLSKVELENLVKPENFKETSVSDDKPAYIKDYQAPTELGTDMKSGILEIDGALYQMPIPVTAFIENGWTLQTQQSDATVAGTGRGDLVISKNGKSMSLRVTNNTPNELPIEYTVVEDISFYDDDIPAKLPNGIYYGMPVAEFEAAIANTAYTTDTESSYAKYYLFATKTYSDGTFEEGIRIGVAYDEPNAVNSISIRISASE